MSNSLSSPPLKIPFAERREREFLYLKEVDILIAATQNTRAGTRNASIAMLLFCQTLQPVEIGWLRWCDVDFKLIGYCKARDGSACRSEAFTILLLKLGLNPGYHFPFIHICCAALGCTIGQHCYCNR